jgi:proton-dependent oligopeptide transporter, POT family
MDFIPEHRASSKTWHPALGLSMVSLAMLFERLAYYGVRSILVLFLLERLQVSEQSTHAWYSNFILCTYFLVLIGGFIGDLEIPPAVCILFGCGLEAAGCFSLAVPHESASIMGMGLIALGSGFFRPNITKQMAALYGDRPRYMDAGFSILYTAINIGAFLAPIVIGSIADKGNPLSYSAGFIAAGIISILSVIPVIISFSTLNKSYRKFVKTKRNYSAAQLLSVIFILAAVPFFWMCMSLLEAYYWKCSPGSSHFNFDGLLTIVLAGPVFAVVWTFFYINPMLKVAAGFFLLLIPSVVFTFISPCIPGLHYVSLISEVLVAIPVFTVIGRYAPPKIMGTLYGLSALFSGLSFKLNHFLESEIIVGDDLFFKILLVSGIILFCGLFAALGFLSKNDDRNRLEIRNSYIRNSP